MSVSDGTLRKAVTGTSDLGSASLATRILVSRLRREVAASPDKITAAMAELRDFFTKNAFAAADLQKI